MKKIRFGRLALGIRPAIVVPFSAMTSVSAVRRAKAGGMDAAELRLDLHPPLAGAMSKFKGTPLIATVRSKKEGGRWKGPEKARLELFKSVMKSVDAVDIELSSASILKDVVREARRRRKTVIISYHNFKTTPAAAVLENVMKRAKMAGADIVKIAVTARSGRDVERLAQFTTRHASRGLITLSMGSRGVVSRVLFPAFGSLVTFAHLGRGTAPGQMDLETTSRCLAAFYSSR